MNVHETDNNNKSKKKNKKKKKKKNNGIIIQNEEILSDNNDPVVDKFKSELNSYNTKSDHKIRPKLSSQWIDSIKLNY